MNLLVIVLRLIHIVGGVFWVGSSLVLGFFISPAVAATAEAGQKFVAHVTTKARITSWVAGAAGLTVLAGGALYWIDSQGLSSAWQRSGPGLGFGIGGLLALIGFVFGLMVGKNTSLLGSIASQVQGKPTSEQMDKIHAAQKQLAYAGPISMAALLLALLCMATACYWVF